jgi:uncharacterized protein involved in outer membrane biogenesis
VRAFIVRRRWTLLATAAIVLIYAAIGFVLVPRIARAQLQAYATDTLHRQLSLGTLRFNPFTLTARVEDFSLHETDGTTLLAFKHLLVNAQLASLWQRGVNLKEVRLESPEVQLVIDREGRVNLANLLPPSNDPVPATPAPLPRVRIGVLAVTGGRIGIEEHMNEKPFTTTLAPIQFTLTEFKTDLNYENAYRFAATSLAGEQLEWAGEFTVQPLGSTGRFAIKQLKAATIDSFLDESLPILTSGELTLSGQYQVALHPSLSVDMNLSSIAIRDLALAERPKDNAVPLAPVIKLPTIDIADVALSYAKRSVAIKSVTLGGARADVRREKNGAVNLARLFAKDTTPPQAKTAADEVAAPNPAWTARVDSVQIADAAVSVVDNAVAPAAHFDLHAIAVSANNWSTDPKATVQVTADVAIDKGGKLTVSGDVQPTAPAAKLNIRLNRTLHKMRSLRFIVAF